MGVQGGSGDKQTTNKNQKPTQNRGIHISTYRSGPPHREKKQNKKSSLYLALWLNKKLNKKVLPFFFFFNVVNIISRVFTSLNLVQNKTQSSHYGNNNKTKNKTKKALIPIIFFFSVFKYGPSQKSLFSKLHVSYLISNVHLIRAKGIIEFNIPKHTHTFSYTHICTRP